MKRVPGLSMAIAACMLLAPIAAQAQKPKDSKYTKDAGKFIGLAMTRQSPAERMPLYQQALDALREGFEKDADNPKLWYTAGQTYAGLRQFVAADSAFDKAVSLYPEYKEEVDAEREAGWMDGFQMGVELMDQQKYDEALVVLEGAQDLYDARPEALLNIGSIYANKGDLPKAEEAFEKAAVAASGPMLQQLDTAAQEQWKRYADMAKLNIAQMRGSRGVEAFQNNDYEKAADWFAKAAEVNPYSRDYLFNLVQARYAQATQLEEQRDSTPAMAPTIDPQLTGIYRDLETQIADVRKYDPNNENLLAILVRAHRRLGEISGDTLNGQKRALSVAEQLRDLPVEIAEMTVSQGDGTATVNGTMRKRTLEAGKAVRIKVTLLYQSGQTVGTQEVTVNAPEKEQTAPFQATTEVTGQVAGWRYEVVI
jgi:tetratricopeptide (TPR) repeat protein